jgi:hypothetical protein
MTKRKNSPAIPGPKMECSPERIGGRNLIPCPVCGGFGAIMHEDGDWTTCKKCGGGGRAWEEVAHAA